MKKIGILGASGSVGTQTIQVLEAYRKEFKLISFSVGNNIEFAKHILHTFPEVEIVCTLSEYDAKKLSDIFPKKEIYFGDKGLEKVACANIDILVTSVVGSVGLIPTYKAIEQGIDIALANKETLVTGGDIILKKAAEKKVRIIPVDSEHSAIFQCLNGENTKEIRNLIVTASGGALRDYPIGDIKNVSIKNVLAHPNWSMGKKITVDSATMMNKGLEVIEAHHLFQIPYEQIQVLIHRESIIHSMVEFVDGGIMAQLGSPDMKLPIQYALTYPQRKEIIGGKMLDITKLSELHFSHEISKEKYPCFYLALECGKLGHSYPVVLNAANEIVVAAFLAEKIPYCDIATIIRKVIDTHKVIQNPTLEEIIELDLKVRKETEKYI